MAGGTTFGHQVSSSSSTVMKVLLIVSLGLVALVAARPSNDIIDFETDQMEHEQEGTPGRAVEGEYSWVAPDGNEYKVKYIADHLGYRVIEDNVVPKAVEVIEVAEAEGEAEDEEGEEPSARAEEEEEEEEEAVLREEEEEEEE